MLKAKRLNLQDAFRLASTISKYVNELPSPKDDAIEFIGKIVEKIEPEEYLACVSLMTKTDVNTIKEQEISLDILTSFIEGLRLNQIVSLLGFTKSLGL